MGKTARLFGRGGAALSWLPRELPEQHPDPGDSVGVERRRRLKAEHVKVLARSCRGVVDSREPPSRDRQTRFGLRPLVPGTLHRLGVGWLSGSATLNSGRGDDRSRIGLDGIMALARPPARRSSRQPLHFCHPFLQHAIRRIAMQPWILAIWVAGRCWASQICLNIARKLVNAG